MHGECVAKDCKRTIIPETPSRYPSDRWRDTFTEPARKSVQPVVQDECVLTLACRLDGRKVRQIGQIGQVREIGQIIEIRQIDVLRPDTGIAESALQRRPCQIRRAKSPVQILRHGAAILSGTNDNGKLIEGCHGRPLRKARHDVQRQAGFSRVLI